MNPTAQFPEEQSADGEFERQEDAFDGLAHPAVLHGWLADDGSGVDRVFAVGDATHVEGGVEIFERVETGVVAEWSFGAQLVEVLPREEFDDEHLPGAINLPLKSLTAETSAKLDRYRPVIVYCYDYQ